MTRMLYMEGGLERCYDTEFRARVVEAQADWVSLDQTLFYPLGGGQEWDTGVLAPAADSARVEAVGAVGAVAGPGDPAGALKVVEVTKRGPVKHVVGAGHGLRPGDEVVGCIDWERRYAHMRMHTAQHLVSGLAYELFGNEAGQHPRTVGNQIHRSRSRIDFNPVNFTNEMLKDLEDAANGAIRQGFAVSTGTMTRDEVNAELPPERTNMDLLPKSVSELRVIRIGKDVDLCPCAGTHVQGTREIGELRILKRTSKGSGTQRIEYTLAGLDEEAPGSTPPA